MDYSIPFLPMVIGMERLFYSFQYRKTLSFYHVELLIALQYFTRNSRNHRTTSLFSFGSAFESAEATASCCFSEFKIRGEGCSIKSISAIPRVLREIIMHVIRILVQIRNSVK